MKKNTPASFAPVLEVLYVKNGSKEVPELGVDAQKDIFSLLSQLGASEQNAQTRQYFSAAARENLLKSGIVLEIKLYDPIAVLTSSGLTFKALTLFFPLSGDLAPSLQSESASFLVATDKGYLGAPFQNPNAQKQLVSILKILGKNLRD